MSLFSFEYIKIYRHFKILFTDSVYYEVDISILLGKYSFIKTM